MIHDYAPFFPKRAGAENARAYLSGLLSTERRKNIERIAERSTSRSYGSTQWFVSESPWDHEPLMDALAREADGLLGGSPRTALLIDESGFAKKGKKSVGVARQYLGRHGKVDNGQVGVFAALSRGRHAAITDFELFLPESWSEDTERCAAAGVPAERIAAGHRTKIQLADQMIRRAVARGQRFAFIGMDGLYGSSDALLQSIEEQHLVYMADVPRDRHVYAENPRPQVPQRPAGARGRTPKLARSSVKSQEVQALIAGAKKAEWTAVKLRNGSKGPLMVKALRRRVWRWDGRSERTTECWLLAIRRADGGLRYALSNAAESVGVERLARMQAQRWMIERSFQDAKSEAGMAEYQVRGWLAWHHHMALVSMAMLFFLRERVACADPHPILSLRDVVELLEWYLPKRGGSEEEVLSRIRERHKTRQSDIERRRAPAATK